MNTQDINTSIVELTSVYDALNKSWQDDKCLTDLYQVFRQKEYKESYDKLENTNIENIVLGILENSLNDNILIRLRTLLDENIQIYENRQSDFINIDFHEVYSLHQKHLFDDKFTLIRKDREDIQDFTYPSEQEKEMLLKENQQEKNLLENERWDYNRANVWMIQNYYTKIFDITQSFITVINSYFPIQKEKISEIITETDSTESKKIEQSQPIEIEPDMIFRTNMYDKLLLLEKQLIKDKYLNENLNWIAKHDTNRTDIKTLVTFLVGLLDNKYFLPGKDPKIRRFFENRYQIKIGQNFEVQRRNQYLEEYKNAFFEYRF